MELRTPESQKWRVLTTAQIVTECTTSNPQLDRFVSQVEALTGARGNAQLVPAGVRLQKLLLNLAVVSPLGGVANEHLGDMAESRGDSQNIVSSVGRGDRKAVVLDHKDESSNTKSPDLGGSGKSLGVVPRGRRNSNAGRKMGLAALKALSRNKGSPVGGL